MINLYTALRLAGISDEDCVCLTNKIFPCGYEIMTGRNIKEKFDLRKVKVTRIRPWFICEDYEGWKFEIVLPKQPGHKNTKRIKGD